VENGPEHLLYARYKRQEKVGTEQKWRNTGKRGRSNETQKNSVEKGGKKET